MAAKVLFICAILETTLICGRGEVVLGIENDEFDFDGLPGAAHEFKVSVGAGREECFFQKIVAGGKLHVSFETVYGGDRDINLLVKHVVNNQILAAEYTKTEGQVEIDAPYHGGDLNIDVYLFQNTAPDTFREVKSSHGQSTDSFDMEIAEMGPYAICLDNSMSRLHSKLVYVYIVTYVQDEWENYVKEIEDLHITMGNFTVSIDSVKQSIAEATLHQAQSRMHVVKDWYLVTGNNKYITYWSILQCCVIIVSTCCQVYFLRRLFRYTNVKPARPRA